MKMSSPDKDDVDVELLESSFTFHDYTEIVEQFAYTCQIMKMEDSFYVYIGQSENERMDGLIYAFLSAYDNLPVAVRLTGLAEQEWSLSLASRLTALSGKHVYISCNLEVPCYLKVAIGKRVTAEFKKHMIS
ncbi:uncharacterized protein LOC135164869 isoform X2 [Diachasmimorpha longicaudata]